MFSYKISFPTNIYFCMWNGESFMMINDKTGKPLINYLTSYVIVCEIGLF